MTDRVCCVCGEPWEHRCPDNASSKSAANRPFSEDWRAGYEFGYGDGQVGEYNPEMGLGRTIPNSAADEFPPAERCACGVVSRGLVDGVCADCRDATCNRVRDLVNDILGDWPAEIAPATPAAVEHILKRAGIDG